MARQSYDVAGRTVLVTGAARGIGAETARQLAARGAHVSLVGIEPELLERTAAELGAGAAWFEADVTDWDALGVAVEGTVERFGGIDVVVANAGIYRMGTVQTIDPGDFERQIEVNLLGVWRTVRACLDHVVVRRGYVLPIASLAASAHLPLMAAYSASKAGVEAFADALRLELAGTGTRVGCAYFGFIDTDMVRDSLADPITAETRRRREDPFSRPVPVGEAGAAIVHGIETRARRVVAPRRVLPILMAGRLFQQLLEAGARRSGAREAVRLADERARGGGPGL